MWEKGQHKCCPGIKRKIFKRNNTCTSSQYDFILEQQPVPSSLFSKFNIVPDQKCFMFVYIIILADTLPGKMCLMGNSYSITHVCLYYYFSRYTSWEDVLDGQQSAFSGYVNSEAKLEEVIDTYEYATSSKFCVLKKSNSFGRRTGKYRNSNGSRL